jgi:hypothetical protein
MTKQHVASCSTWITTIHHNCKCTCVNHKLVHEICHVGGVTIKRTKKDVGWQRKIINIGKIFIFYHLKPLAIIASFFFSFIWMSNNSNQKSIWYNFKFEFWFRTFESQPLLHQKGSILQRIIKRTHIIKENWWGKKRR